MAVSAGRYATEAEMQIDTVRAGIATLVSASLMTKTARDHAVVAHTAASTAFAGLSKKRATEKRKSERKKSLKRL